MKKISFWTCVAVVATSAALPVQDAMKTPRLRDVRLKGVPAAKMNDLIRARLTSDFAKLNVFAEARRAFVDRDDDVKGHGGVWRGEFWGKQMLSAARVADYLADPAFTKFVQEECHRLMATQDPDGYLGSYKDKELVSITDPEQTRKTYGWYPVWNIWNRKYAMWGMLMAYKATGDREIFASVERQMKQLIGMLHRRNLKLHDTGTLTMHGLPSMSILKPLVMLYEETGDRAYLDFAAEMLPDWDRADGECPNFFRNATREPLHEWYPDPSDWAKTYEFLSCVDGLIEYYRATGDARCLETAKAIRDNLQRNELNVFGSVGFGDKIIGASLYCNALNEVCDVIHWIRLNVDLFLVTGDVKYLDIVEVAYFNGYLAGIWRGGAWGPFFIRGHKRHSEQRQCGYAYNHCCVNNLPRTFMDMASVTVTRDRKGTFHVNFYQDASVELDGVRFEIAGNYPVGNVVKVSVSDPAAKVASGDRQGRPREELGVPAVSRQRPGQPRPHPELPHAAGRLRDARAARPRQVARDRQRPRRAGVRAGHQRQGLPRAGHATSGRRPHVGPLASRPHEGWRADDLHEGLRLPERRRHGLRLRRQPLLDLVLTPHHPTRHENEDLLCPSLGDSSAGDVERRIGHRRDV